MDDEPMWAADRVVALTPGSAITILETANEFAIKGNHLNLVKGNQFDGRIKTDPHKHIYEFLSICDMFKYRDIENEAVRLMMFPLSLTAFSQHENETLTDAWLHMKEMLRNCHGHNLSKGNIIKIFYHDLNEITQEALNATAGAIFLYKTPNQAYQLLEDKVLLKLDWAKNQKAKSSLKKTIAFADEGSSNYDTDKIMARMDVMTMKMDAQYKEIQSRSNHSTPDCNDDDTPMSHKEEAKFMQTLSRMPNYGKFLKELISLFLKRKKTVKFQLILGRPFLHTADAVIRVKQKQFNLGVGTKRMTFLIDSAMKNSYSNDDTCFSIDVIDEILEEDFDALLDEGE
ncbi:hypothetical protein Tco_1175947 [Tanacetum coccineum]